MVDKERKIYDEVCEGIRVAEQNQEAAKAILLREERHRTLRNINDLSASIARHADVALRTVMLFAMVKARQRGQQTGKPGFAEEEVVNEHKG